MHHSIHAHDVDGSDQKGPVGLLAGGGNLPGEILDALASAGRRAHVVALRGSAEPGLADTAGVTVDWVGIAQIGHMLASFRQHGCQDLLIAGYVRRPDLRTITPDLGFFTNLPAVLALLRGGDDRLLRCVIRFFEGQGFTVRGLAELTPDLLAPAGPLTPCEPDAILREEAEVGKQAIAAMAPFDVGQAVVVRSGRVVAVEGAEGTDVLLERLACSPQDPPFAETANAGRMHAGSEPLADDHAGHSTPSSGVLVKFAKPGQDMRVDLPTIGPATITNVCRAGLVGIAIQAGGTLIIERPAVIVRTREAGIPVWGSTPPAPPAGRADTAHPVRARLTQIGRRTPPPADLADSRMGWGALAAAGTFCSATAAVVSREYVLAIGVDETPEQTIIRSAALRQWGDRKARTRRRGAVVLAPGQPCTAGIIKAAADAGLRSIVQMGQLNAHDTEALEALADEADRHKIALVRPVA